MAKIPFKTPYAGDNQAYRTPFATIGHSRTKQAPHAECDINNIMQKYQKTGVLDHINHHQGDYSDFLSATSYHESMNAVLEAQNAFDSLPSSVRSRFNNNPGDFLAYVHNPNNAAEMVTLGLATPPAMPSNVADGPAEPVAEALASPAEFSPQPSS